MTAAAAPRLQEADWPAIAAARRHDATARVPFTMAGTTVGSVARSNLEALTAWPEALHVGPDGVVLRAGAAERDAVLAEIHARLRADGLIRGWRDEPYPVVDPATLRPLACIERAASRFWGTLTFGAHGTGYRADAGGRPVAIWVAHRATSKPTDPGLADNLVGGGVAAGQTAVEALVREGWEEAGLSAAVMARAQVGRVVELRRDIAHGLQHERLHTFDLRLAPEEVPCNQDGEVDRFELLPVAEALALASGEAMTVDAALVTLDFALRHRLLPPADARRLAARTVHLWHDAGAPG